MYRYFSFVIGLLACALAAGPADARVIEGRVIEIPDGATLTVLAREGASIHRVRLAGIDAPSMDHPAGGSSRENLRRLIRGKSVRVETTALDSKGMLVGVVTLRSGSNCTGAQCQDQIDPGLVQLTAGLAWIDGSILPYQPQDAQKRYAEAESKAKAKRVGLWRDFLINRTGALQARQSTGFSAMRRDEPFLTNR